MLDRISIAAPCASDWDSMPGSDRVRHFFFNDTAASEIYTLSLHDALPISSGERRATVCPALSACRRYDSDVELSGGGAGHLSPAITRGSGGEVPACNELFGDGADSALPDSHFPATRVHADRSVNPARSPGI